VIVVMAVEGRDVTGVLGLFKILVSYSHFHFIVLWNSSVKIIINTCGS
jgi:hypothetical protein